MTPVKVKDETTTTELGDIWVDYVGYITQVPEDQRPLWVAYDPEPDSGSIHLIAVVPANNKEARYNLYQAETFINNQYPANIDTLVIEEGDFVQTDADELISIYPDRVID